MHPSPVSPDSSRIDSGFRETSEGFVYLAAATPLLCIPGWPVSDGTIAQENTPMNKEDVLTKLRELKPAIMARYKVREIGLFGSFVRGEQGASSDIDLLAEFEASADLFDLIGLELYLEEIFRHPVDVIPKQSLRMELRETALHQVVTV